MSEGRPEPIGYRAFVARAASDARPEPLHIDAANFSSAAAARAWVEQARAVAKDPANFAASIVAVYGVPL